tara:strand:- start:103592 stop:104461 length:870 start_codon:yes stop_codon:yes gene_type:complete
MSKYFSCLFFPLTVVVIAVAAVIALQFGAAPSALPVAATVIALALVLVVEARAPRVRKRAEPGEFAADVRYATLTAVVDGAAQAGISAVVILAAAVLPLTLLSEIFLPLGVVLALLVGGLGDYWAHRWSHEWSWWWRLHSVHHAPHRMVALNNLRLHPVDLALKLAASMVPLLLLGFSPEVLAMVGVLKGLTVAFQHANLDLRHGALNYIFATNSVHRWHHSSEAGEANANYGGILMVFDLLFGSYRVPREGLEPKQMGLFDERFYPIHQVWRASVAPLCWQRCVEKKL